MILPVAVIVQSFSRVQFCDPMDCSTPGLPIHHQLPELAQTHVHQVGDVIQPSHPLSSLSACLQSFPASGSFPMSQFFASGSQSIGASASASDLPRIFRTPLVSEGLSTAFSSTTVRKHHSFSAHPSLWSNSHISK